MIRHSILSVLCFVFSTGGMAVTAEETAEAVQSEHARFFEARVRPLLAEHCYKCHSEKNQKGALRVDSLAGLLQGGDSGEAIVTGKPEESLLIEAVRYEGYEMPPGGKLSDEQIEVLETWVRLGAPWPGSDAEAMRPEAKPDTPLFDERDRGWWAIAPIAEVEVPSDSGESWAINPIDHFIARRRDRQGLTPAPEASREALIRRLCYDLTGLPPTPQQIEAFLSDDSAGAYEALVDRLLDSPEYGKRYARHWLDVARYADTDGYRADHTRPNAWRYRDYVIDSLNKDKPYDQFIREQIAGDELYPDDPDATIATGFLTHGIYEYNSRDVVGQWNIMLNEVTDTIGDVFMGVGMQCSQCHDHKFDPILQKDYFALRAFVEPMLIDRQAGCATAEQIAEFETADARWREATKEIRTRLAELEKPFREKAKHVAVIKFPESIQKMMKTPAEKRTPREHQLAELAFLQVDFEYDRLDTHIAKEAKEEILELRRELQKFDSLKPKPLPTARAATSPGEIAPPTVIPKKRQTVDPAFLSILSLGPDSTGPGGENAIDVPADRRRTALADWLADPSNPLSTRVIVNRVWGWHFGKGLAPNASDFGFLGGPPTHPELLDWLTSKFVNDGWRLKPLHRLIVTSATYRQSSHHAELNHAMRIDPRNTFYWKQDVRRLDAEQIRDSILAVSESLDPTVGGPPASDDKNRRSIYTIVQRNSRNPLLDAFDLPLFFNSTASRDTTTNPLQSLMLINSQAMLDHAKELSDRVDDVDPRDAVSELWMLVYGRHATSDEQNAATGFIESQAKLYETTGGDDQAAIATSTLPYRGGASIVIDPGAEKLRAASSDLLDADEFTIEATFQIDSIYDSGEVRSIVSTWTGKRGKPGWTFGVTGKGSRRKPQTLVLHAFGNNGKTAAAEAAVFSDQQVDLKKPYYAAATVRMPHDGSPGTVTFRLKDLSDEEQPVSTVTMDHDLVGGLTNESGITIGGRSGGKGSSFDGLIDDVRLSRGAIDPSALLLEDEAITGTTIGFWKFEPAMGLGKDVSSNGVHLRVGAASEETRSPVARAMSDLCHVLLNSSEFLYVR